MSSSLPLFPVKNNTIVFAGSSIFCRIIFLCFLSTVVSFRNTNIHNVTRYLDCSFHAERDYEFACHKFSEEKTDQVLSFQALPKFNFHDPEVRDQIRNSSIVFFGDSLMRNQFISMACLLFEYDESITEDQQERDDHFLKIYSPELDYEIIFVNHHTLFDAPISTIYKGKDLKIGQMFLNALKGDYSTIPGRTPNLAVVSAGHHFIRGQYDKSCTEDNDCDPSEIEWDKFEKAMLNFNLLLKQEINKRLSKTAREKLKIVWRSVPARHYSNGEWNTAGSCPLEEPCFDQLIDSFKNKKTDSHVYKAYHFSEILKKAAFKHKLEYLDISRNSFDRCDGHVGKLKSHVADCSHYCVPGVPDTWHDGLLEWL
jgi:hypothetical protein